MMKMMQGRVSITDNLESLGALSTVFIDSIIREKNLDYLQYLCTHCESMTLNYLWFTKESGDNKKKLLMIYQLAISYSKRLEKTYRQHQNQLVYNLQRKREEVRNKRKQVKEHKIHVTSLKEKMRFMKLNKVKGTYQQYLHKMKDLQYMYEQQKLKNRTAPNFFDPMMFQNMQMQSIYATYNPQPHVSTPPYQPQQPSPGNFQQPSPGNFQQPSPGNFQQSSPGNFQQPSPGNFQQPSPGNFQQSNPGNFQQPSPGAFQQHIKQQGRPNKQLELYRRQSDNRKLENSNIFNLDDENNGIQHSDIIAKNGQVVVKDHSQHKQQSEKIILKDFSKSSKRPSRSNDSCILSDARSDTIGNLHEDSLRRSQIHKSGYKNQSQIYHNNIESINKLQLAPNSNKSEKPEPFESNKDVKENPDGNPDLFQSNMGSPNNIKSKQHFGGLLTQNSDKKVQNGKDQVIVPSSDVGLLNLNQGNVFEKKGQEQGYNIHESNYNHTKISRPSSHNQNHGNVSERPSQEQKYNIRESNFNQTKISRPSSHNSNHGNVSERPSQEQKYNIRESNYSHTKISRPSSHNSNHGNVSERPNQEQKYDIYASKISNRKMNQRITPQGSFSRNSNHENISEGPSQEQDYDIKQSNYDHIKKSPPTTPLQRPPSMNKKSLEESDENKTVENFTTMSQKNLVIAVIPPKKDHKNEKGKQIQQESYADGFDDFGEIPENSYYGKQQQSKSKYVGIPKKEFIPLMKPGAYNMTQSSMIGSLRQHSFVKRSNPNFKKSSQDISETNNNDFLNDLIQIPQQSTIARPSLKINIKPKSKLSPPHEKRTLTSQSISSHGDHTKNQTKQSSSGLSNPKKYPHELSVPLGDSFELPEGSSIRSKVQGGSDIKMLVIPGSFIQEKSSQREKNHSKKVKVPLVDSTLIDESKTQQIQSNADKFSSILNVPGSFSKQNQKEQRENSFGSGNLSRDDDELIEQKIDLNDSLMAQHEKQDIELKLFTMLKMNASTIPQKQIKKFDSQWIQKELLQTVKKTPSQIKDWVAIQKLYQRQFNAMQSKLAKKREENDNAVMQAPRLKIDKEKKFSGNDDDLTYSRSIIDPLSGNDPKSLSKKKISNDEKYSNPNSDIQIAMEKDKSSQNIKKIKQKTTKEKVRKISKEQKKPQQKEIHLSTVDERSSNSTYEPPISGPEDIIGKIQQGHRYDVQNPLDKIIRDNKTLFKKEIKRKYEDQSDW